MTECPHNVRVEMFLFFQLEVTFSPSCNPASKVYSKSADLYAA